MPRPVPALPETFRDSRDNLEPLPVLPIPENAPSIPTAYGKLGKPSRTWSYRDAEGRLLFYVCRFENPKAGKIPSVIVVDGCRCAALAMERRPGTASALPAGFTRGST